MVWMLAGSVFQVAMAGEAPTMGVDEALEQLAAGNLVQGCRTLKQIVDADADSVDAWRAQQIARTVNGLEARRCEWVEGSVEIASDGRTELIVSQGLVAPIWLTTAIPVYAPDAISPGTVSLAVVGGLGLGIGGTYLATRNRPITEGQAMMVYTGEVLGTWYGAWIEGAVAGSGFTGRPAHAGFVLGGLGGVGSAILFKKASAGDVALIRSGAVWGTTIGGLSGIVAGVEGRNVWTALGVGTTAGIGVAAALAPITELRRGQVNTVNLGGYAGALTGGAVALITQPDGRAVAGLIGGGAIAGLGVGALIVTQQKGTRNNQARSDFQLAPPHLTSVMAKNGELLPALGLHAQW